MMISCKHIATLSVITFLGLSIAFAQTRKCATIVESAVNASVGRANDSTDKLYIPILFHIVYNSSEQNISLEQVHSQIRVLNDDFNTDNENWDDTIEEFIPYAANPNIEFYLYNDDYLNLSENGIVRVETSHSQFVTDDLHYSQYGGSDVYLPEEVLNVWVADLGGDVFGYSQSVPTYPLTESGVAVDFEYLGTMGTAKEPFDGGRTLTHEIGHYFGLKHPWLVESCGDGDGVSDTPDQEGAITTCDLQRESCGNLSMTQNFMNLAPDQCMTFFTSGQISLMRTELFLNKSGLIHDEIVLATKVDSEISVYPIPSSDHINLVGSTATIEDIEIIDSKGKKLVIDLIQGNEKVIITPINYVNGFYLLRFKNNGHYYEHKLILEK